MPGKRLLSTTESSHGMKPKLGNVKAPSSIKTFLDRRPMGIQFRICLKLLGVNVYVYADVHADVDVDATGVAHCHDTFHRFKSCYHVYVHVYTYL